MKRYRGISETQHEALEMRFEEHRTIFDIAQRLNLSWDQADQLIESALGILCMRVIRRAA